MIIWIFNNYFKKLGYQYKTARFANLDYDVRG